MHDNMDRPKEVRVINPRGLTVANRCTWLYMLASGCTMFLQSFSGCVFIYRHSIVCSGLASAQTNWERKWEGQFQGRKDNR